ncbi:MAG TPA: GAF domain-containing protein [Anaerolineales bacterium]|nr:GAF domain-containing protein [Anaerolineales bacterium]
MCIYGSDPGGSPPSGCGAYGTACIGIRQVDQSTHLIISDSQNEVPGWFQKPGALGRAIRSKIRMSLGARLIWILVGVSLISILLSSYLLFDYQHQQFVAEQKDAITLLSSTLESSLRQAMLSGEPEQVNSMIQMVASEPEIISLRILDLQGEVQFSSQKAEVGTRLDLRQQTCQLCHAGALPEKNATAITEVHSGEQVLINGNLIPNTSECHACHDPQADSLGVMLIEASLAGANQHQISSFWRSGAISLLSVVLLVALVGTALNRYVHKPLSNLSQGVAEISAGNLDEPVMMTHQDEIGDLVIAFNDMRVKLKQSYQEQEKHRQDMAVMNEVALAATQLLDVQDILNFTLDTMVDRLGMLAGLIFLWDDATKRYTPQATRNISQDQVDEIERRRKAGWDITREVADSGQEIVIYDIPQDYRFHGLWDDRTGQAYIKVPMMSRGTVVGVLSLISPAEKTVTQPGVEYLKAIGREVGIAIDNALLLKNTRQGEKEANALYKLGSKISASLALDEVLDAVAEAARELLEADIGLVGLFEEESQEVVIMAVAGDQGVTLKGARVPVHSQAPGNVLLKGQPIIANASVGDALKVNAEDATTDETIASFLAVPLERGEHFLGLVEVMIRPPLTFRDNDAQLLMRLATQVVVAIENAQLYLQLRHMAALQERDRLAREMHDHLAQSLGYINVRAAMTDELLSAGKAEQALENIRELKRAAKIAYTDVREEIFNLRTTVASPDNFFETLKNYLSEYRTHYGVIVELTVDAAELCDFDAETGSQLLRIIQEALGNVRKHSGASLVRIHFHEEASQVLVCIEDNGEGFDLERVPQASGQHYGLQIMRERAESVGGSLTLESAPGQGTRVIVCVPGV